MPGITVSDCLGLSSLSYCRTRTGCSCTAAVIECDLSVFAGLTVWSVCLPMHARYHSVYLLAFHTAVQGLALAVRLLWLSMLCLSLPLSELLGTAVWIIRDWEARTSATASTFTQLLTRVWLFLVALQAWLFLVALQEHAVRAGLCIWSCVCPRLISLAGAATSIIFVATKIMFVATNICCHKGFMATIFFLSRQT